MGQEELRSSAQRQQLVEVVGGGRAGPRVDPLLQVGVVQQAELAVVDHLVLLAFPQRLDRQPELLLDLVHRVVVQIGDPGVHLQDGLRHAQLVLARGQLVVDEGTRQLRLPLVARGQLDDGFAVAFCGLSGGLERFDMGRSATDG